MPSPQSDAAREAEIIPLLRAKLQYGSMSSPTVQPSTVVMAGSGHYEELIQLAELLNNHHAVDSCLLHNLPAIFSFFQSLSNTILTIPADTPHGLNSARPGNLQSNC